MQNTALPSLVTLTGSGGLTATLPFTASLGSWTLSGAPSVTLSQANPFSGLAPAVQFNADAGPALPFRALNAGSFSGLINELATWADDWINVRRPQGSPLDSAVTSSPGYAADMTLRGFFQRAEFRPRPARVSARVSPRASVP